MTAKDSYNHGSLRRALLDEALAVIGERGVEGLSLREIASRAGVSHAAPYHHFADKTALIRAVAFEGMAAMDEAMAAAEEAAGSDPSRRLLSLGMAYVTFAVEHPDYYAAFTAPEISALSADAREPEEPHGNMWGRLLGAVVACQDSGCVSTGDPVTIAVQLWSLVHGLVQLWRYGPLKLLPQAAGGLEPLARSALECALVSLETRPTGSP